MSKLPIKADELFLKNFLKESAPRTEEPTDAPAPDEPSEIKQTAEAPKPAQEKAKAAPKQKKKPATQVTSVNAKGEGRGEPDPEPAPTQTASVTKKETKLITPVTFRITQELLDDMDNVIYERNRGVRRRSNQYTRSDFILDAIREKLGK